MILSWAQHALERENCQFALHVPTGMGSIAGCGGSQTKVHQKLLFDRCVDSVLPGSLIPFVFSHPEPFMSNRDVSIEAVIFDMDGLLLDTERVYLDGFRLACDALKVPFHHDFYVNMIGLNGPSTKLALRKGLVGLVDPHIFEERWRVENAVLFQQPIEVKPGVHETITGLRHREIPYAIATSTKTSRATDHLDRAGLHGLFPVIIGGDQVKRGKPSPDIYLKAAASLNFAPQNCVAFEDSENGVRAALSAGMMTVQVPDMKQPSDEFRKLGHMVADDLRSGVRMAGVERRRTVPPKSNF